MNQANRFGELRYAVGVPCRHWPPEILAAAMRAHLELVRGEYELYAVSV